MPDIVSIGELLVDFTYVSGENGDTFYKQNAGGARESERMANCIAQVLGIER